MKKSFGEYLIELYGENAIELYWSDENEILPFDVSFASPKKFYINCQQKDYHTHNLISLHDFTKGCRCSYCGRNGKVHPKDSFAQWGIDNFGDDFLDKYWSDENILKPFEISSNSHKKVWIKCREKEYHGDYEVSCNNFVKEHRCGYCKGNKIVHPKDSFGYWLVENYGENTIELYWSKNNKKSPYEFTLKSNKKIYINCQEKDYHEFYETTPDIFLRGHRCPYCSSSRTHRLDSIASVYPVSLETYSNKNKKDIYSLLPSSNQKPWWKCECGKHDDFKKRVADMVRDNFRCPECSRERLTSLIQESTTMYIKELGYDILHEFNCNITPINPKTKAKLPFDNEVVGMKLIIEVHGEQHYNLLWETSKWLGNKTPEEYLKYRKLIDRYKKFIAYKNGYEYLELPYWCFEDDGYKKLIDDKIKCIKEKRRDINGC